jgi:hypothetical protein
MKTKKPNTLQQKLGFFDEDLKKPKHDELMIWLDKNIERIVNDLYYKPFTNEEIEKAQSDALIEVDRTLEDRKTIIKHYEKQISYLYEKLPLEDHQKNNLIELEEKIEKEKKKVSYLKTWQGFDLLPDKPAIQVKKIWEYPITTQGQFKTGYSSKYTVGFIDMAVCIKLVTSLHVGGFNSDRNIIPSKEWTRDIIKVPYIDFETEKFWIYIEVKTEINSLGELIRQIQHYKEYNRGKYFVLCPDSQYKELLNEQGIGFLNYS